jgi:hypothetical protein
MLPQIVLSSPFLISGLIQILVNFDIFLSEL